MKKKLINHALDVAKAQNSWNKEDVCKQYVKDKRNFVTNGHIILETENPIEGLQFIGHDQICDRIVKFVDEIDNAEYYMVTPPSVTEIKDNIRRLCGRKLDRVIWRNEDITLNARYLYKAMEVLNATRIWVSACNKPIYLFENDIINAVNKELIFPIVKPTVGYGFSVS